MTVVAGQETHQEVRRTRHRTRRANAAEGPREKKLEVKLTVDELDRLKAKAGALGVSVQGLMVSAALSEQTESAADRRAYIAQLADVQKYVGSSADNMNQIAKKANTVHEIPAAFNAALTEARHAYGRCEHVLEQLIALNRRAGV